ncbi:MAG: AAA family ATPase [Candidatus Sulfotelmatobacter sp.]
MGTFLEIATPLIQRGIPVIPVQPNEKRCLLPEWQNKATTDIEQVKLWQTENPNFNIGCVGKPDGFVMLDCDVVGLREQIERETKQKFPRTLIVKSAGKGAEHIYFRQTDESRRLGNRKSASLFDLQSVDRYVVGAGSTLSNGKSYEIVDDSPIADFPLWLAAWIDRHSDIVKEHGGKGAPVHEDFDFDRFCDHFGFAFIGDNDGKYFFEACPYKGDRHTSDGKPDYPACAIFYDGATIGFSDLATSCEGNGKTIGDLIRFRYGQGYENYDGKIFAEGEKTPIEELLEDFGVEVEETATHPCLQCGTQMSDKRLTSVCDTCFDSSKSDDKVCYEVGCDCKKRHPMREEVESVLREDEERQKRKAAGLDPDPDLALVTVRASEVKMEKLEWLWQERIPLGKITWLCGLPDCGKTFVALDLVARVSSGREFPDGTANKWGNREVLLGVTEDGVADTVVPRLVAAKANLENVHIIKCVTPEEGDSKKKRILMLKEDIVRIHRYIKAHPQISLVVLDPLTSYLGEVDYNKDKEIRPVMDALSALCEKTKVTFVAVMHLNKRSDVGAIHKILGASSVAGSARVAWGFSPDPEDRELKHMSLIKNNISKQRSGLDYKIVTVEVDVNGEMVGHGAVEWQGVNEMNADDQMQHTKEVRGQKKEDRLIDKAMDFLRRKFAEKPEWKVGGDSGLYKLAEAEGLNDKTVKRARERLRQDGLRLDWDNRRHVNDGYWLVIRKDYVPDPTIPADPLPGEAV